MSEIPSYLKTRDEQRLYYLACRWASENRVNLHGEMWYLPKVMELLQDAGALAMSEMEPLPNLSWRPPEGVPALPVRLQPREQGFTAQRKPQAIEGMRIALGELRKKLAE